MHIQKPSSARNLFPEILKQLRTNLVLWTAVASAASLAAQSVPEKASATPLASTATKDDDTIQLDVFTVNADKDTGFIATQNLSGGRMATELSETPISYTVQTRDFLDALNLTTLDDALEWSVNTNKYVNAESGGIAMGSDTTYTTRGLAANSSQRNFFAGTYNADVYNVERFDFARGPNSTMFGAGSISGMASSMTKFARSDKNFTRTDIVFDDSGSQRLAFDYNHKIGKRMGARLNAVSDITQGWRDYEVRKSKGIAPSFTFKPNQNTEIRLSSEYFERDSISTDSPLRDNISGWDGVTTFSTLLPTTASYGKQGISRVNGSGTATQGYEYWMFSPDNTKLMNYVGTATTVGWSGNSSRAITMADGSSVTATSGSMSIQVMPFQDKYYMPMTDDQLYGPAESAGFKVPSRKATNLPTTPIGTDRFKDLTAMFTHRWGDFNFLVGANVNRLNKFGYASFYYNNGTYDGWSILYLDPNKNLPDGTANPYYLKTYCRAREDRALKQNDNNTLRASMAYIKSLKWVDISMNTQIGREHMKNLSAREYGVLGVDADTRQWGRGGNQARLIHFYIYEDQVNRNAPELTGAPISCVNPQTGATSTYTPIWTLNTNPSSRSDNGVQLNLRNTDYFQYFGQFGFMKRRLVVTLAYRIDDTTSAIKYGLRAMDYPTGYIPTYKNYIWRPDAPADYYDLTYAPKSTAGVVTGATVAAVTRPLDSTTGARLSQYSTDRFRDDYNPPSVNVKPTTKAIGAVYQPFKRVAASLFVNYSQSYNPPALGYQTIDFGTPSPARGEDIAWGLRSGLGSNKFVVTLTRYSSNQKNFTSTNPPGYSSINTIINSNAYGDVSMNGVNARSFANVPTQWADVIGNQKSQGWEMEIDANLSRGFRMKINGSVNDSNNIDANQDTRRYIDTNKEKLRQIVLDTGATMVGDVASNSANISTSVSPDITTAISAWNDLMTNRANKYMSGSQKVSRSMRYQANIYADYSFQNATLKGLRIGFGWRFKGPQVIGYQGSDTIQSTVDGVVKAVDDPSKSAYDYVWARSYGICNATIGYSFKAYKKYPIDLQLAIDNLFNYDYPIYNSIGSRPVNQDITNLGRTYVYTAYTYMNPRSVTFRTTLKF